MNIFLGCPILISCLLVVSEIAMMGVCYIRGEIYIVQKISHMTDNWWQFIKELAAMNMIHVTNFGKPRK